MQGVKGINPHRTTIVCVDSFENGGMRGRMYNGGVSGEITFNTLMEFLLQMETMLDNMQFTDAVASAKSFQNTPPTETTPVNSQEGKLATFSVRVFFRQNASWQGALTWIESGKEESFRSALELLLLMNSALEVR